jgi:hypothetical protein
MSFAIAVASSCMSSMTSGEYPRRPMPDRDGSVYCGLPPAGDKEGRNNSSVRSKLSMFIGLAI